MADAPISILLVQVKTPANVLTNVFVCPASQRTFIDKIGFGNMQTSNPEKVSLAFAPQGVTPQDKHYFLLIDFSIAKSEYLVLEPKFSIGPGDAIWVKTEGDIVTAITGSPL